jgi:hypothetical protein
MLRHVIDDYSIVIFIAYRSLTGLDWLCKGPPTSPRCDLKGGSNDPSLCPFAFEAGLNLCEEALSGKVRNLTHGTHLCHPPTPAGRVALSHPLLFLPTMPLTHFFVLRYRNLSNSGGSHAINNVLTQFTRFNEHC